MEKQAAGASAVNVKMIYPTVKGDIDEIDVRLPVNILLRDVFFQLAEWSFLSNRLNCSGLLVCNKNIQEYIPLDNDKTIEKNGIKNDDIILIEIDVPDYALYLHIFDDFRLAQFWHDIYPYLDQFETVLGITGVAIGVGTWIKKRFGHTHTPKQFTEVITDKEFWNAHELALRLNITDDESKALLKGYGYKWDKCYRLFYKTDKTVEIIEKIKVSAEEGNDYPLTKPHSN